MTKNTENHKKLKHDFKIQRGATKTDSEIETLMTGSVCSAVVVIMRLWGEEVEGWRSGGGAMTPRYRLYADSPRRCKTEDCVLDFLDPEAQF